MNKKIIYLGFILAAFIIAGCTKGEQKTVNDIPGWNKTHWGMTEDEIKKVYKDKIVKLDTIEHYNNDKEYSSIGLKDAEIINTKFNVFFIMDQDTKKLVKVFIRPAQGTGIVIMFKLLEVELMKKYGPPFYRDMTSDFEQIELVAIWNFPSTKIQLIYNADMKYNFQHLNIAYMQNKKVADNL